MRRKFPILAAILLMWFVCLSSSAFAAAVPVTLKISAPAVLSGESAQICITVKDSSGKAVTVAQIVVDIESDAAQTVTEYGVQPDQDGEATVSLTTQTPGTYTITAYYTDLSGSGYADAQNTAVLEVKVPLKIYEAPTISQKSWPYGTTLSEIALEGGQANVAGTFSWKDPDQQLTVGKNRCAVVFTPDDSFYQAAEFGGDLTITIVQDTPVLTSLKATPIENGESLSSSKIEGEAVSQATGKAVSGTFTFADPSLIPDSESETVSVIFTPDDTENYKTVSGSVTIESKKGVTAVTDTTVREQQAVSENSTTETIDGNQVEVINSDLSDLAQGTGNIETQNAQSADAQILSLASAGTLTQTATQNWVLILAASAAAVSVAVILIFRKKIF